MQYAFTEDQAQFRDIVARFCRERSPTAVVRRLAESERGFDPVMWTQLCQELALVGIHVSETSGGSGFGPVELGIVMEEFGRCLLPVPYLSCGVLACTAIAAIDDAALRDELMAPLVAGEELVTLALEPLQGHPVSGLTLAGERLSGNLKGVLDGASADRILILTGTGTGARAVLCGVDPSAAGVEVRALRTMDRTRRLATVTLDNVPVQVLAELDPGQIETLYDTALVALANEMSGGAQALLKSAIDYTKLRVQFGRAVGSFQAIKHRLADLHVDVELAKVSAWQAAAALAAADEPSANASLAKFTAADAYVKAALETIQFHGGIGFTWENDTHLWYRRAKSSEVFLGSPAFHRERMLREMGV